MDGLDNIDESDFIIKVFRDDFGNMSTEDFFGEEEELVWQTRTIDDSSFDDWDDTNTWEDLSHEDRMEYLRDVAESMAEMFENDEMVTHTGEDERNEELYIFAANKNIYPYIDALGFWK